MTWLCNACGELMDDPAEYSTREKSEYFGTIAWHTDVELRCSYCDSDDLMEREDMPDEHAAMDAEHERDIAEELK
jgi:hypothetical protein